jgi:hypothetical protein
MNMLWLVIPRSLTSEIFMSDMHPGVQAGKDNHSLLYIHPPIIYFHPQFGNSNHLKNAFGNFVLFYFIFPKYIGSSSFISFSPSILVAAPKSGMELAKICQ